MEGSSYIPLKYNLSSIPASALSRPSRLKLSKYLNREFVLPTKNGNTRDYRGLAELMGFYYNDVNFERCPDCTGQILNLWVKRSDEMLDKLIDYLQEMERYDVIKELIPLLERDVEIYLQNQKLKEITVEVPGERARFDAYVSYADEDFDVVCNLTNYLEEVGLKLFIRARDMIAGYAELDANIELIKNRCRRTLIILTPNYLKSPECRFQISFAASLAIDECRRLLIPVIVQACEVPLIVKFTSKIDLTKPGNNWVYEKLVKSLLTDNESSMFLSPTRGELQGFLTPKLKSSFATGNTASQTFPKELSSSVCDFLTEAPSVPSNSFENSMMDSSPVSSKHKARKRRLYSPVNKSRHFFKGLFTL